MWYIGSGKTQERLGDEKQLVIGRKKVPLGSVYYVAGLLKKTYVM